MHTDTQKLRHLLEDAGFEPRVATALSHVICEQRDQKRASQGDGAQIATRVHLKEFARQPEQALVFQALTITLVVATLLRLIPYSALAEGSTGPNQP